MIVSTCGFGSTGSSAVCDYLMECEGFQNFDAVEFTLSTMVDGLEDLEFHIMKQNTRLSSSIYAIQRFRKAIHERSREWSVETSAKRQDILDLTNHYLKDITQLTFIGNGPQIDRPHNEFIRRYFGEAVIKQRIIPYLEKKKWLKKNIDFYPLTELDASIRPSNFYEASKRYVSSILTLLGCDLNKSVVLDQAFVGNDPEKSFPFFNDPYAIVVDRDPRDLYIFAKKVLLSRGRFMPIDSVEKFITYYRMMRDNQPYKIPNERILVIPFESMVYDYDKAAAKIDQFLGCVNKRRKSIFDPSISIANTNLVRKFPEFKEDVAKIERQLNEYLFPFEKFKVDFGKEPKEMFFGKSPLNKQ